MFRTSGADLFDAGAERAALASGRNVNQERLELMRIGAPGSGTFPFFELAALVPPVCTYCGGPHSVDDCPVDVDEDDGKLLCVHYRCDDCCEEWQDEYSCACDSDCPKCGETYEALSWHDVDEECLV